jgi:transcription antitermination factor NusB
MKHVRSRAREAALKVLYQVDVLGEKLDAASLEERLGRERLGGETRSYALRLAAGCVEHGEELDRAIGAALEHWELARVAAIDRAILRLGVYELLFAADVPAKVTINEAIELAKKYSTPKSGSFINGILDEVRRRCEGVA